MRNTTQKYFYFARQCANVQAIIAVDGDVSGDSMW